MLGALKAPPPTGPLRVDSGCKPRLSTPDSNRRSQGVPALPPLARQRGAQVGRAEHDFVPPSRPAEQRRGRRRVSRQAAAACARAVRGLSAERWSVSPHGTQVRQSLIGTRSFGTGHRREPYSSNTASWADVSGHNTLKIGRGKPRRSKGGNPYPTSSKAFGPRDPADVPHRASRGGAGPFLTTAHGATRQPRVDSWSRCPYVPHGPRRLWSRWPVRAARASVSWHA